MELIEPTHQDHHGRAARSAPGTAGLRFEERNPGIHRHQSGPSGTLAQADDSRPSTTTGSMMWKCSRKRENTSSIPGQPLRNRHQHPSSDLLLQRQQPGLAQRHDLLSRASGHIDFFQNNHLLPATPGGLRFCRRGTVGQAGHRQACDRNKGRWVDYVIEFARGIDNLVGFYGRACRPFFRPPADSTRPPGSASTFISMCSSRIDCREVKITGLHSRNSNVTTPA
jgi:hypothetical protein